MKCKKKIKTFSSKNVFGYTVDGKSSTCGELKETTILYSGADIIYLLIKSNRRLSNRKIV